MKDLHTEPVATSGSNRGNARALEASLRAGEGVIELAEARLRGLVLGLLAVTDSRILYVQTRIIGKPLCIAYALGDVRAVTVALRPVTGELTIDTTDGSTTSRTISPKERANKLAEAIAGAAETLGTRA